MANLSFTVFTMTTVRMFRPPFQAKLHATPVTALHNDARTAKTDIILPLNAKINTKMKTFVLRSKPGHSGGGGINEPGISTQHLLFMLTRTVQWTVAVYYDYYMRVEFQDKGSKLRIFCSEHRVLSLFFTFP